MPEGANLQSLARQAMTLARNHIVLHLRFMDMAVFRLRPTPADTTLATDGARLYYGEKHVLRRYMRVDQQGLSRDYLHALMHCVFRHPFITSLVDRARWDLACDIAVTDVILSMDDAHFALPGDYARRAVIEQLRAQARHLTAEGLYRHFEEQPPNPEWADLFLVDDHVLWHKPKRSGDLRQAPEGGEGEDGSEGGGDAPPDEGDDSPRPEPEAHKPSPSGESNADGDEADASGANPSQPPEGGDSADMDGGSAEGAPQEGEQRRMREGAPEGKTGHTVDEYGERHPSSQRNTGRGMDTEGRDGMAAGSQSRSANTEGGLDAKHSLGTGGDSADAQSQSGASDTGGSGAGLNDAFLIQEGEAPVHNPDLREERLQESRDQLEREWKDVGERIQNDLETFSRQRGGSAGSLLDRLRDLNRERIDYAAFLRKFAVLGEAAELNHEDFDQIFYTYGLKLYGNLPLIEPLETREVLRVRDFVIAIDTSGSTSGALVKRFLETTWGILKGEENFFRRINLHIVQCDAQVRETAHITSQREFDAYVDAFAVKGLGGTDFRPVFQYVDELLRQGAFTRLKGLIYFTDGMGAYPARKPDYETAFVFMRGEAEPPAVPPWAMRVVLDE